MADYGTFLNQPYELAEMFTDGITLKRLGKIGDTDVEILKTIRMLPGKPVMIIDYAIANRAPYDLHSPFGIEWNLALMSRNSHKHHISLPETGEWNQPLGETRAYDAVQEVRLADEQEGVAARFSFDGATGLWRAPIESISNSEGGFERVFQSVALLFRWELHLEPGQVWKRRITASLSRA
jgi:alpha-amylase